MQSNLVFRFMETDMRNDLGHNHMQYPCAEIFAIHSGNWAKSGWVWGLFSTSLCRKIYNKTFSEAHLTFLLNHRMNRHKSTLTRLSLSSQSFENNNISSSNHITCILPTFSLIMLVKGPSIQKKKTFIIQVECNSHARKTVSDSY